MKPSINFNYIKRQIRVICNINVIVRVCGLKFLAYYIQKSKETSEIL